MSSKPIYRLEEDSEVSGNRKYNCFWFDCITKAPGWWWTDKYLQMALRSKFVQKKFDARIDENPKENKKKKLYKTCSKI